MEKVLYYTKHKKPITKGQKHLVVLKDNTILDVVAEDNDIEDPNILVRFLTRSGAMKFVRNNPIIITPPVKTEEELLEDKIKSLNSMEQLDYIKNESDFKKWLCRNSFRITTSSTGIKITNFISFMYAISGVAYCCGGREMGSHNGEILNGLSRYISEDRLKIICKYIVKDFEESMKEYSGNFGIVSYIVSPDNIGHPSARIGYLLAASELFTKATTFKNPNTNNILDMYIISDKWPTNLD